MLNYLNLIEPAVERLVGNLTSLGTVVSEQLEASERKAELLRQLSNTHAATRRLLAPGLRVMEADLSRLRRTIDDANITADRRSQTMARAAQSIAKLQPLQKAQFEESTINDTLLRVSASQLAELPVLAFSAGALGKFVGKPRCQYGSEAAIAHVRSNQGVAKLHKRLRQHPSRT